MTNELKHDLSNFGYADGGYIGKCSHCNASFTGDKRAWSCKSCAEKKALEPKTIRATPSTDPLAGLKRWKHCEYPNQHKMMEHRGGDYVLHSDAAKIVAEQSAHIDALERQALKDRKRADEAQSNSTLWQYSCDVGDQPPLITKLWERLKTAEAELEQIKAQEPVMWLCVHDDRGSDRAIATSSPSRRDILKADGYEITPLYASPLAPEGGNEC